MNTRAELAAAAAALRDRINEEHMLAGVTIVDPQTTWIEPDVEIEPDAEIHPFTVIQGKSKISAGAVVGPHAVVVDAEIGAGATVGPFCYLRYGTHLEAGAKAGTFVEIKNSRIGVGAKVPHLSYIGDADVGEETNIGAGAITANYRPELGPGKFRTEIGRNVHTGSDNVFVAPVTIGDNAWVAAGSVVTKNVPPGALAVARSRQVTKRDMPIENTTTELTQLPGLEAPTTGAVPSPERFIERGPWKRLMLFAGRSHPELAERIAETLGVELGEVTLKTFANGETYGRYNESIRGADVFLVQTGCQPNDQPCGAPDHDRRCEARIGEANHGRPAAVPLLPPGQEVAATRADHRQARRRDAPDRRSRSRADDGPSCRPGAGLLHDPRRPHDGGTHLRPVLPRSGLSERLVAVSPDAGRAKLASRFGEMLERDLAVLVKDRPAHNGPR